MRKLLFIAALLAASPSYAQDKEYTLTINASDLNTISDGLMNVPYGKAFPLINKLREQVLAQQKPSVPASPAPETKDAPASAK